MVCDMYDNDKRLEDDKGHICRANLHKESKTRFCNII